MSRERLPPATDWMSVAVAGAPLAVSRAADHCRGPAAARGRDANGMPAAMANTPEVEQQPEADCRPTESSGCDVIVGIVWTSFRLRPKDLDPDLSSSEIKSRRSTRERSYGASSVVGPARRKGKRVRSCSLSSESGVASRVSDSARVGQSAASRAGWPASRSRRSAKPST